MSTTSDTQAASQEPTADTVTCRTARFTTQWLRTDTAVISAHGEIDAANSQEFIEYALRHANRINRLILDLSGVEFFGTAGFSALHTFNVRCVGERIEWALAPSSGMARILKICDPDRTLPTYTNVDEAISAVQHQEQPLLQLVPKSR
ncbi:STAS domain-containing protein [Mycolicibacterium pulveris]|nr:STAS domain-containing protein [Mycolicibacterium pulveris]MCV6979078.1 STAS domain-containing protein [Mycolicibacterium pulveris]